MNVKVEKLRDAGSVYCILIGDGSAFERCPLFGVKGREAPVAPEISQICARRNGDRRT
jgi:hypothetical protein